MRYLAPQPITADHLLESFACGQPALDMWLKLRALANEGRASRSYVVVAATGSQGGAVVGYYSLAAGGVALRDLKSGYRHNLPDPVPVMVLGRLAVDHRHAGQGLGTGMLREAMRRTLQVSRMAGVRMMAVHAIDDAAVAFYQRHGFHVFPAGSRSMFLPVETIAAAL